MGILSTIASWFSSPKEEPAPKPKRVKPLTLVPRKMLGRTVWEAASHTRGNRMYAPQMNATPDAQESKDMRDRVRMLCCNDSLAAGAIKMFRENVITAKINPQSRVSKDPENLPPRKRNFRIRQNRAEAFRGQIEAAWPIFASEIDPAGRMGFEDLINSAYERWKIDGEVFLHKVQMKLTNGRRFKTAFEIIEIDRLVTPNNKMTDPSVCRGIKIGEMNEPVLYYVAKKDVSLGGLWDSNSYETLTPEEARLVFQPKMAGQVRGVTEFHSVLQSAKNRKDLDDATIRKMQKAASITAVANSTDPAAALTALDEGYDEESGDNTYTEVPLPFGEMLVLPDTDRISEFDSTTPSDTYGPFQRGSKSDIANGLGVSYLSLTRDGTAVNYSSMRGLYLQDRMQFQSERAFFTRRVLNWIWECFVDEAVLGGWAEAPNYNERRDDYIKVTWHHAPWGWVDPKKEIEANVMARDNDIVSAYSLAQSAGGDAEQIVDENLRLMKYKEEKAKEMGIVLNPIEESKNGQDGDEEEESSSGDDAAEESERRRAVQVLRDTGIL